MSEFDLPPLDDDVRTLLQGARRTVPAPADVRARLLVSVESAVLGGNGPGGAPTGGGGSSPGAAAPRGAMAVRAAAMARWVSLAASFVLGGVAGGLVVWRVLPPRVVEAPPRVVVVDRPEARPLPAPAASPTFAPAPSAPPAASAAGTARSSALAGPGGLSAERAILDEARASLERGDGDAALRATREHELRFPAAVLAQEREVIAIRALLLLDRRTEARVRLERFRARYPDSALLPTLESQVPPASTP